MHALLELKSDLERAAAKGITPITVKIDNAGNKISVGDGGPSKNIVSGSNLNFFGLFPEVSSSSLDSSNISLSLKSPFAQALKQSESNITVYLT